MFIYGAEKIQLSLENGDFGLESGEIAGESIILPNTITPYTGDYFEIPHIKSKLLFKLIACKLIPRAINSFPLKIGVA